MTRKRQSDAAPSEGTPNPSGEQRTGGKPPVHEVRIGRVRCTVWENQHEKQGAWFSVTLSRSYKDQQGNWKSAQSFGRDDLLVVAEATRLAFLWIARKNGAAGIGEEPAEAPTTETEIPI